MQELAFLKHIKVDLIISYVFGQLVSCLNRYYALKLL